LPEPLAQEVQQERWPIVLQRPLPQPRLQGRLILDRQRTKTEMVLNLPAVIAAGLVARPVVDIIGNNGGI